MCRMLSLYQLTEDDIRSSADHLLPPENSLPGGIAAAGRAAGGLARMPIIELMKVPNQTVCFFPSSFLDFYLFYFLLSWYRSMAKLLNRFNVSVCNCGTTRVENCCVWKWVRCSSCFKLFLLGPAGFDEWESDFPKHYEYLNVGCEHCDGATDKPAVWPSFGGCYFSMPSDPS